MLMALAAGAPAGSDWQSLSPTALFNESSGFGWVDESGGRSLVVSPDANVSDKTIDSLHASVIVGALVAGKAPAPSTLRLVLPGSATTGVVTIVTGSNDNGRQAATTAVHARCARKTLRYCIAISFCETRSFNLPR